MSERLGNYIAALRKQAGLSQLQLAKLIGYRDRSAVSSHERLRKVPPLLIAIAYSVVFRKPVSQVFAGMADAVEHAIEAEIAKFEQELKRPKSPSAGTAKTLRWVSLRIQSQPSNRGP